MGLFRPVLQTQTNPPLYPDTTVVIESVNGKLVPNSGSNTSTPLLRAGNPLDLKDILDHVTIRKPKLLYNDHKLLLFKPMQLSYAIAHLIEQPNLETCE